MKISRRFFKAIITIAIAFIVINAIFVLVRVNIEPKIHFRSNNNYEETITVCTDNEYPPFSFIDKDGKIQGYDVELIYLLAEEMKVNVDLKLVAWNEAMEYMNQGNADIILGLEYNEKYREEFMLSNPVQINEFIAFGMYPVDRLSLLKEKKLGALENSTSYDLFIKPNNLQDVITYHSSYEDGFKDVLSGKIDYLIGRYSVGKRVLNEQGINEINAVGKVLTTNAFCIGVQKDKPELLEKLNLAISKLNTSGRMGELGDKWLGHFIDITSVKDLLNYYWGFINLFIILVSLLVFWSFASRKEKILQIEHDKDIKKHLQKNLEIDELTGLISKYKFDKDANKKLETASAFEYAVLSLDIDNFKNINKVYGYDAGSDILIKAAESLVEHFDSDALITRVYADNFLVFTKNPQKNRPALNDTKILSHKLRGFLGKEIAINFSEGIYIIKDTSEKLNYMIDYSNTARLEGKSIYGDSVNIFTDEMKCFQASKNNIISSMELALKNKEFYVLYQPKYNLKTGLCVGAEALVRWKTASGITYLPGDFIPLFEENNFIIKLDNYVMESVCAFLASSDCKLPTVSVNLSGKTILDEFLIDKYRKLLSKYSVDANKIEIEITESAIIDNFALVQKRVDELKTIGFKISMDDFGTGISSLSRLLDIKVDIIKFDRNFISSSLSNKKGILILKNILSMIKELNLSTVAEGVETKEQLEILRSLNCEIGQGYYFSHPEKDTKKIDNIFKIY